MRRMAALLVCALLCVCCAFGALAAPSPDLTRTGSIHFRILSDYDPVPGGDLWLMRVADLSSDANGNAVYVWVPELRHLTMDVNEAFTYENAKVILDEALKSGVPARRTWIDNDGRAVFTGLKPGLYLF